jgi:Asp-tRNA(Asn)/Glu-tRNA(Gln) amidotransferase A subunit family amidase
LVAAVRRLVTMTTRSAAAAVEATLARIGERDGDIHAWAHVDADGARQAATSVPGDAPLAGLVLGVKDIIDVGGMPCELGSAIHRGRVPARDAALVAELKALGAVFAGKTATTELAFLAPAVTRNPRDLRFSPGGSSSGSAAAVADGHVDAALGTQTAGSLLRPASFCGAVGFKPTHGRFSLAGVKSCSPSLDTIGWIARDVTTAARIHEALTGRVPASAASRIAFARTVYWEKTEPQMQAAFEALARRLLWRETAGPAPELEAAHMAIMRFEMLRELATERLQFAEMLSPQMRGFLDPTLASADAWAKALELRAGYETEAMFDGADILATPAALGEAPLFGSTGDAAYNRFPSLLGLPSIAIPFATGVNGMPLGLQLVARRHAEPLLLASAAVIEVQLADRLQAGAA